MFIGNPFHHQKKHPNRFSPHTHYIRNSEKLRALCSRMVISRAACAHCISRRARAHLDTLYFGLILLKADRVSYDSVPRSSACIMHSVVAFSVSPRSTSPYIHFFRRFFLISLALHFFSRARLDRFNLRNLSVPNLKPILRYKLSLPRLSCRIQSFRFKLFEVFQLYSSLYNVFYRAFC